jgi:FtsH-binding integral membrane protein
LNLNQSSEASIFEKDISPFKQGLIILAATLFFQVIIFITASKDGFLSRTYWTTSIALVLVFILFNAVLSLSTKDQNNYYLKSIITYVVLCIAGGILAYFFSKKTIDEAGPYRWMYIVFTMVYILILAIIRSMKWIVEFAQKKDKRMRGEE